MKMPLDGGSIVTLVARCGWGLALLRQVA